MLASGGKRRWIRAGGGAGRDREEFGWFCCDWSWWFIELSHFGAPASGEGSPEEGVVGGPSLFGLHLWLARRRLEPLVWVWVWVRVWVRV